MLLECSTHALKTNSFPSTSRSQWQLLRMSWVCKHLWVSGIQLGFLQMAALRTSSDVVRLSWSMVAFLCSQRWDILHRKSPAKFPGYLSPSAGLKFADVPNGLAAISKVPAAGWGQILAYMAFCEVSQDQSAGTPAAAGDFGWKLITSTDPEVKKTKLNAELANGRLAMMAIIGMFFQVMGEWWWVMFKGWRVKGDGWWVNGETSSDISVHELYENWSSVSLWHRLMLLIDVWPNIFCILYLFLILWGMIHAC